VHLSLPPPTADFYINVRDNTQIHGPFGQDQYEEANEADPCFGRVVEGKDVVDRLHTIPTVMDETVNSPILMERLVAITAMRILSGSDNENNRLNVGVK